MGDVVSLPEAALHGNPLTATRQRSATGSRCKAALSLSCRTTSSTPSVRFRGAMKNTRIYFFWSRRCSELVNINKWVRKIDRLNDSLSFKDEQGRPLEFRSHMLRDTFAVELLLDGVPLEKVSKLLTHESVAVTERYYSKWTGRRKQQLEDEAVAAMRRMGASFAIGIKPCPCRAFVVFVFHRFNQL